MFLGTFKAGDSIPLTITYQNALGADVPATDPMVEIIYIDGAGAVRIALPLTPMRKRSPNIQGDYFYLYTVPAGLPLTKYFVNYKATVDDVLTTGEDSFNIGATTVPGEEEPGMLKIQASEQDLHVVDGRGVPISGVKVVFYDRFAGKPVAQTTTDSQGDFLAFLPPGSYIVLYSKDGWFSRNVEKSF